MTNLSVITASKLFEILVNGFESDRAEAQAIIDKNSQNIDLNQLRLLIIDAISKQFRTGKENQEKDSGIIWTRCWLLSTLGRISRDNIESENIIKKHLDSKNEPVDWVRYWALEGLIAGRVSDIEEVARELKKKDKTPLVRQLATAFLASRDDQESQKEIEDGLEDEKLQWATLRALRIVPIPSAVKKLCDFVGAGEYSNETYDAIIALGSIPTSSSHAENAAQTIAKYVTESRRSSIQDGMRVKAIQALGNLRRESSTPILLQELADNNPAISREAAWSLEKVLGSAIATTRVVEAASKVDQQQAQKLANALRYMDRDPVAETLEELMVSGSAGQQEVARILLQEMGGTAAFQKLRARTSAMAQYTKTMEQAEERIQELFKTSITEAQSGYKTAVRMDLAVFFLGLVLLAVSAGSIIFRGGTLDSWVGIGVTGGTGVLGVIYSILIRNPRNQVDKAVDHLMRLKIVFLAYLRQLHQADQAYTRRLLEDENTLTTEEVQKFCDMVGAIMHLAIERLASMASKNEQDKTDNKSSIESGKSPN